MHGINAYRSGSKRLPNLKPIQKLRFQQSIKLDKQVIVGRHCARFKRYTQSSWRPEARRAGISPFAYVCIIYLCPGGLHFQFQFYGYNTSHNISMYVPDWLILQGPSARKVGVKQRITLLEIGDSWEPDYRHIHTSCAEAKPFRAKLVNVGRCTARVLRGLVSGAVEPTGPHTGGHSANFRLVYGVWKCMNI